MIPTEIRLINKIIDGFAFHTLFGPDQRAYAELAMKEITRDRPKSEYLITVNGLFCKKQMVFSAFFTDLYFLWYKFGEDL